MTPTQIQTLVSQYLAQSLEDMEQDMAERGAGVSEARRESEMDGLDVLLDLTGEALAGGKIPSFVEETADEVLAANGLTLGKQTPAYKRLCRELVKAQRSYARTALRRWNGEYNEAVSPSLPQVAPVVPAGPVAKGLSYGDCLKKYMAEPWHRRDKTNRQIEVFLGKRFLKTTGLTEASPIQAVNRAMCRMFKEARLAQKVKPTTLNLDFTLLGHFLKWCKDQDYYSGDLPGSGLQISARAVSKGTLKRVAFTEAEVETILTSPHFTSYKTGPRSEFYWATLLLFGTGARRAEVTSLLLSDVRQNTASSIHYLNLQESEKEGKLLKTAASTRLVPVSDWIIKAGFLAYVQQVRQRKRATKLFPSLRNEGANNHLSKWFTRLLRKLRVKRPDLTLHSARHYMTQALAKAGVQSEVRHRILGHSMGKSVEDRVYFGSLEFPLTQLKKAIDSVKLPAGNPSGVSSTTTQRPVRTN